MATIASLEPADPSVDPGGQASVTVRVRNTGSIVDRYDLTVVGPLAPFATALPASLSLFPGQEGEARIVFAPPRGPEPRAGRFPFGVRVAPAANPRGAMVEEGRVTIGPFTDAGATIVPATSRGSRSGRHEVNVENRGNAPVEVALGAADPDRLLSFEVSPDRVVVGPGERATIGLRASARSTFLLGSKRSHPFDLEVRPGRAAPIALRATLLQGPILPGWLPPLAGLAVIAIVALIALPLLTGSRDPRTTAGESTAPSQTVAPATPTVDPNATPTPDPNASPSGDATPGATPTPGPFELTLIDDSESPFNGALRLRCPETDAVCRSNARDTLMLFINGLTVRYDGYGIANPRNPAVPNTLPVSLTRDQPFTWQADAGLTGTSNILVVDLAPLVASPPSYAYAVVDLGNGTSTRFVVPHGPAQQLFDTLFEPAPQVDLPTWELPTRPVAGFDYVWNNAIYTHLFVAFTPSP